MFHLRNYVVIAANLVFCQVLTAGSYTCSRTFAASNQGDVGIALNGHGQVLEQSTNNSTIFVYISNPDGTRVQVPNGSHDMNNRGDVAGQYQSSSGDNMGFIRHANGAYSTFAPPSGLDSTSFLVGGINDRGYISGVIGLNASAQLFIRDPEGTYSLIPFPFAYGTVRINNANLLAVNYSNGTPPGQAYLVSADGTSTPVNFPGLSDARITGLSDTGWISGYVFDPQLISAYATSNIGFVRDPAGTYQPVVCPDTPTKTVNQASDVTNDGTALAGFLSPVFSGYPSNSVAHPTQAPATLTLSSTDFTFSPTPVGQPSDTGTIVLTNTGQGSRKLAGYYLDSSQATDFDVETACAELTAGQSCTLNLTFFPNVLGESTGAVYLITDDPQGLIKITLQGDGTPGN